jgi:hypothetical protein
VGLGNRSEKAKKRKENLWQSQTLIRMLRRKEISPGPRKVGALKTAGGQIPKSRPALQLSVPHLQALYAFFVEAGSSTKRERCPTPKSVGQEAVPVTHFPGTPLLGSEQ